MKILHLDDIFYPEAGYLVNIISKYEVLEGHEVIVLTSTVENWAPQRRVFWGDNDIEERDALFEKRTGAKIIRYYAKWEISDRLYFDRGYYSLINEINPDIIFIHNESGFNTFHFLIRYHINRFPIILDTHMVDFAAGKKLRHLFYYFYRHTFARIIINNKIIVIRTQEDDYVKKRLGIPLELAPFISFGSDLTIFHPDKLVKKKMRNKLGIPEDSFVVIVTGKLTEGKGGMLLAETFYKRFTEDKIVTLITVGTATDDEYGRRVSGRLEKSENMVVRIPTQKYYDLAQYYQCSDLAVFAKQCSLSFYDAQACGLPVVLEDNSVNLTRVTNNNGKVFKSGDVKDFRDKIKEFIELDNAEMSIYADNAVQLIKNSYNYENISRKYTALMEKAIINFRRKSNSD